MSESNNLSRRDFVKTAGAAAAASLVLKRFSPCFGECAAAALRHRGHGVIGVPACGDVNWSRSIPT